MPKNGGAPELFADVRYAEDMRVLGDKLFFVVEDNVGDGGENQTGGLYVCPLNGPVPCQPSRVVVADNPAAIAVDGTRVIFSDYSDGHKVFDTANNQTSPLTDRRSRRIFVDGTAIFYNFSAVFSTPQVAYLYEYLPDASVVTRHQYESPSAEAAGLAGNKDAIFTVGYDWEGATTGGVVHRHPRAANGLPCDYGGTTNKRPYGLTIDAQRIFWTNQGSGNDEPFTGGSVSTCEIAGCCAQPEVLWTGDGQPSAIVNDDNFVYWVTEKTSVVWKVAKP